MSDFLLVCDFQFGIECTKCVKMMVFTHCQGRPFCFFLLFCFFCFFLSQNKKD